MYLTQTSMLRHLTKENYQALKEMCRYANNLYNVALYNIRQYHFHAKRYLTYEENLAQCKENENYRMLPAKTAEQILKTTDRSFQSYQVLKAKNAKGTKMPGYRENGSFL